jgi:hypothetical protein
MSGVMCVLLYSEEAVYDARGSTKLDEASSNKSGVTPRSPMIPPTEEE